MRKISVIIPFYNASGYISECLNSVLNQTLKDIQVICVDDGSTDSSVSIVKGYASNDRRVELYQQKNLGSGQARNLALSKSKGDFIAFMDADDWYPSNEVLARLYDSAVANNVKICGGSFVRYHSDGRVEEEFFNEYKAYRFETEGLISFDEYQFDYGYHRFIYSRDDLVTRYKIQFPDYRRYQDPVFLAKAMVFSGSFYAIPDKVYAYRKGHQVISWDEGKVVGLVCGISDNLYISANRNYAKLHLLNLNRFLIDFGKIIQTEFIKSSLVRYFVYRLLVNIDLDLVDRSFPDWDKTILDGFVEKNKDLLPH